MTEYANAMLSWLRQSVRRQILVAAAAMLALASIAAAVIAVVNGRAAVETEMRSSIEFAEKYLRAMLPRITAQQSDALESVLSKEVVPLRHAELYVIRDGGQPELIKPSGLEHHDDDSEPAPQWFAELMQPKPNLPFRRFIYSREAQASLLIVGHADDEVAEKWHELSALATIWIAVVALLLTGLNLALRRILEPLVSLSKALTALEIGARDQRLDIPHVEELADIAHKFNSLAASLDQTRIENGTLYQQIMNIQEDERRLIASELHDEAGPCLFGITANTESIERLCADLPARQADQIRRRTQEIISVTERLKLMNRALLRRLRPLSLGKVPIGALLGDLIRDFERLHAGVKFIVSLETTQKTYGEKVDLTLYRCVQESLNNALRHGRANTCIVNVGETLSPDDHSVTLVNVSVRDNGAGIKPGTETGFGLAVMRERILSVGGTYTVGSNWPQGTGVTVTIPSGASDGISSALRKASEVTT